MRGDHLASAVPHGEPVTDVVVSGGDVAKAFRSLSAASFGEMLWLLEPGCPEAMYDLVAQTAEREEVLTELWEAGEEKPPELEGNVSLVPWAYAEGAGHFLYWLVRPGVAPEDWTIAFG